MAPRAMWPALLVFGATVFSVHSLITAAQETHDYCTATFRRVQMYQTHWCLSSCTQWQRRPYEGRVVGTFKYGSMSLVCLAALHAGVLRAGEEKHVSYAMNTTTRPAYFTATVRNRIVSAHEEIKTADVPYFYFTSTRSETPEAESRGTDIVMVHNNAHQFYNSTTYQKLFLACLPNDLIQELPDAHLYRWNYGVFESTDSNVFIQTNTAQSLAVSDYPGHCSRVLRCLSDQTRNDVTGIFGQRDDLVVPALPTVTTSVGSSLRLQFARGAPTGLERLPRNTHLNHSAGADIENVRVEDAGLYSSNTTYTRIIVRECPALRYGADCALWCPDCMNGGECDERTGECVCAAGTRGDRCQHFCPPERYGSSCQLTCTSQHLPWLLPADAKCRGLTFCKRDPKGCSCMPGYRPPTCDDVCDPGFYGPDCALFCTYCTGQQCEPIDGRCVISCKNTDLCDNNGRPLNLPRFRGPPDVSECDNRGCTLRFRAWDGGNDEGELALNNRVTGYFLDVRDRSEAQSSWKQLEEVHPTDGTVVSFNFIPGRYYDFRLRVSTQRGLPSPDYNLRILSSTVLRISCLESYEKVQIFAMEATQTEFVIAGFNDGSCSHRPLYLLTVKGYTSGNSVRSTQKQDAQPRITGLTASTTYHVTVDGGAAITVTTKPDSPLRPDNIEVSVTPTAMTAVWRRPQRAQSYNVTLQRINAAGCTDTPSSEPIEVLQSTEERTTASGLQPYTRYELCVTALNEGGASDLYCQKFVTEANKNPDISLINLSCTSWNEVLSCQVTVPNECEKFNGPNLSIVWSITGTLSCNSSARHTEMNEEFLRTIDFGNINTIFSFSKLIPNENYTVSVVLKNTVGSGTILQSHFLAKAENYPDHVVDLTVSSTVTSLALRWAVPCPSRATITWYKLHVDRQAAVRITPAASTCPRSEGYMCYSIINLMPHQKYKIRVSSCVLENQCSSAIEIEGETKDSAPSIPFLATSRESHAINVTLTLPSHLSETAQCFMAVERSSQVLKNLTLKENLEESKHKKFQVGDLEESALYAITSRCCNTHGCSNTTRTTEATSLAAPRWSGQLEVREVTDNNAILWIPSVAAGDAKIKLAVVVHNVTKNIDVLKINFTAAYLHWKETRTQRSSRQRHSDGQTCSDSTALVYVAGQLTQGNNTFVLGEGEQEDGTSNCPLVKDNSYEVAVVVEAELKEDVRLDVLRLPEVLVAKVPWMYSHAGPVAAAACILFIVGLLVAATVALQLLKRRRVKKRNQMVRLAETVPMNDDGNVVTDSTETQTRTENVSKKNEGNDKKRPGVEKMTGKLTTPISFDNLYTKEDPMPSMVNPPLVESCSRMTQPTAAFNMSVAGIKSPAGMEEDVYDEFGEDDDIYDEFCEFDPSVKTPPKYMNVTTRDSKL